MNKKFTIAALALITLASCTDNEFVGETNTATNTAETQPILFGFNVQNSTRANIMGQEAAELLDWEPFQGQYGRCTKGMALTFLGDAYMWKAYTVPEKAQECYQKAYEALLNN